MRSETDLIGLIIGVLHAYPVTGGRIRQRAATVKKGGQMAIYVYEAPGWPATSGPAQYTLHTRERTASCLVALTAAAPLYYLYRFPVVGRVVSESYDQPPSSWRWRWLDTFDGTQPYQWNAHIPEVLGCFDGWLRPLYAEKPSCCAGVKA